MSFRRRSFLGRRSSRRRWKQDGAAAAGELVEAASTLSPVQAVAEGAGDGESKHQDTPVVMRRRAQKRKACHDDEDGDGDGQENLGFGQHALPGTPRPQKKSRRNSVLSTSLCAAREMGGFLPSPRKLRGLTRSASARTRSQRKTSRSFFGSPRKQVSTSSLWSETLGEAREQVLEGMPRTEMKRQEAIFELTSSEQQFAEDLQNLIKVIKDPMSKMRIIDPKQEAGLFANLPAIAQLHGDLARTFMKERHAFTGLSGIGATLSAWIPGLEVYNEYCANLVTAKHTLETMLAEHDLFREFVESAQDMKLSRRMDLWSFLDAPRRRIQRYPLLIRAVLKHTEATHEDHAPLTAAMEQAQQLIGQVDQAVLMSGQRKVAKLQESLEFAYASQRVDLITDANPLLLEMDCQIKEGSKDVRLHLFKHLLLITKEAKRKPADKEGAAAPAPLSSAAPAMRGVVGRPIPMATLGFEDLPNEEEAEVYPFRVWIDDPTLYRQSVGRFNGRMQRLPDGKRKAYTIAAAGEYEKNEWLSKIAQCKLELLDVGEAAKLE